MANPSLLVIVSGSSAAITIPAYVAQLRCALDRRVVVMMTHSAQRFVSREVLGWFADEVFDCESPGLNPVELALSSVGIVVLPATVHTLASAALGLAGSPALTAIAAAPRPTLYVPHANRVMWDKPALRRHVASLRERGDIVIEPQVKEVYEIWRGGKAPGISMPDGNATLRHVEMWLRDIAAMV